MPGAEALVVDQHGRDSFVGVRTAVLVMIDSGGGVVHHAQTGLPNAHAIVHLLVIGGSIALVEPTELFPKDTRGQKKGTRTVVDIAAEHRFACIRGQAASVTDRRAVRPDDTASLLEQSREHDQAPTDSADIGASVQGGMR